MTSSTLKRYTCVGSTAEAASTANIRVVEFDLSDSWQMQSDIDTDDDNRHRWVEAVPQITGNTRTRARRYSARVFS